MHLTEDDRDALVVRASLARSRLSATLETLARKRHELLDLPVQASKHVVLIGSVAGACLAGLAAVAIYHLATARRTRRHERWLLLQRAWDHPERVAPKRAPLVLRVAEVVALLAARQLAVRWLASAPAR
jgi:hypothetical protein